MKKIKQFTIILSDTEGAEELARRLSELGLDDRYEYIYTESGKHKFIFDSDVDLNVLGL